MEKKGQMLIDFERPTLRAFPDFADVLEAAAHAGHVPFKHIAADLNMSVSELSRRISRTGDLPFDVKDLPKFIDASQDLRPAQWLAEKFLLDEHQKLQKAMAELDKLLDAAPALRDVLPQLMAGRK